MKKSYRSLRALVRAKALNSLTILHERVIEHRNQSLLAKFSKLGNNVLVYGKIEVGNPENIRIGNDVALNEGVVLNARAPITIGNSVTISAGVQIHTAYLDIELPYNIRRQETDSTTGDDHLKKPIIIEDGVWITAGVIITAGSILREGSVILPNSCVSGEVPAFQLWGGSPAKLIRPLNHSKRYKSNEH
ncbi:acyltransferase [Coraliomargarita algicola]|uniref:Acyltransferase n=1 Tax=Coraliomargarita algicola TaxID=3092156 RepID=A0ABZ0RR51_9BACT|nr:acyltransferase [Coraliomargarita sp. J2-16]WPJ97372.1 acyltransferase [Coraliomargarita sp. J2-16]